MMDGCIPPEHRRFVRVLHEDQEMSAEFQQVRKALRSSPEALIIRFPFDRKDESISAIIDCLGRQNLDRPGELLVLDPFDDFRYEPASCAADRIPLQKYNHIRAVCALLGAKSVEVEHRHAEASFLSRTLRLKGQHGGATGSVNTSYSSDQELNAALASKTEWDGGKADVEGARHYMTMRRLYGVGDLVGLVDLFQNRSNKPRSHTIVVSLSQEAEQRLSVAAQLDVAGVNVGKAQASQKQRRKSSLLVKLAVEF